MIRSCSSRQLSQPSSRTGVVTSLSLHSKLAISLTHRRRNPNCGDESTGQLLRSDCRRPSRHQLSRSAHPSFSCRRVINTRSVPVTPASATNLCLMWRNWKNSSPLLKIRSKSSMKRHISLLSRRMIGITRSPRLMCVPTSSAVASKRNRSTCSSICSKLKRTILR